jgi:signal transduction histidine kinase
MSDEKTDSQNKTSYGQDERKFLHDLANPLAIAAGMVDALLDEELGEPLTETQKRRATKAQAALDRIRDLLKGRRAELISIQTSAAPEKKEDCS